MLNPLLDPHLLAGDLRASRALTEAITGALEGGQLLGPKLTIVNPPLWELGHVAWFHERWCLRLRRDGSLADSMLANADALYDSSRIAHTLRWDLPLPDLAATRRYLSDVQQRTLDALEERPDDADLQYFVRLGTFHEDMHAEAFLYSRQTLGYSNPFTSNASSGAVDAAISGDVEFAGGEFLLGAAADDGFVFDNEKWAHPVRVMPYRMARAAVTNGEFAEFVDAGGYSHRACWSDEGWSWLQGSARQAPEYWQKAGNEWMQRRFDRLEPLPSQCPVVHVNWHEAQAYCRFAGRRLPTEVEWEFAATHDIAGRKKRRYPWGDAAPTRERANLGATGTAPVSAFPDGDSSDGLRQMLGNVWEWTATVFAPYPGFVVDPYKEYSAPWFNTHRVLRGGSFATPARLIRNTWRNFYTPERCDIFAGFRTCGID